MPVEASWFGPEGVAIKISVQTLLVSRNGAVLQFPEKLSAGQELTLKRRREGEDFKTVRARVVAEVDHDGASFLYAVSIIEPRADFWDIEFPPLHQAEEALARLLMECSFCQRRQVVYLNELELKSFEVRKCVARICVHCDSPSIWVESHSEVRAASNGGERPAERDEKVPPRRNRTRVKARVLACIRKRGFQEEVVVCEDLSKGGISFRSRNEYPQGTRLEVAVPFTPGNSAIFVPIRIVFSQAIPSARLYRHGAAYVKPPMHGA